MLGLNGNYILEMLKYISNGKWLKSEDEMITYLHLRGGGGSQWGPGAKFQY